MAPCRAFWASASGAGILTIRHSEMEERRRGKDSIDGPKAASSPFPPSCWALPLTRKKEWSGGTSRRPKIAPVQRSLSASGPVAKLLSLPRVSWLDVATIEVRNESLSLSPTLSQSSSNFLWGGPETKSFMSGNWGNNSQSPFYEQKDALTGGRGDQRETRSRWHKYYENCRCSFDAVPDWGNILTWKHWQRSKLLDRPV